MSTDYYRGTFPVLVHVSSGPDHPPKYFSCLSSAVYLQRLGYPVTLFFNGNGVNGLVRGNLEKMTGNPLTADTIAQQLGMPIPRFLHGDQPTNLLEWAQTFVRHGGSIAYCGTTNTWVGNASSWMDRSKMEPFAMPLNLEQVAALLTNKQMKYIAF